MREEESSRLPILPLLVVASVRVQNLIYFSSLCTSTIFSGNLIPVQYLTYLQSLLGKEGKNLLEEERKELVGVGGGRRVSSVFSHPVTVLVQ